MTGQIEIKQNVKCFVIRRIKLVSVAKPFLLGQGVYLWFLIIHTYSPVFVYFYLSISIS